MDNYLLVFLISLWSLLISCSLQCDFGQAMTNHSINLVDSLMFNADVAVLKTYDAGTVKKCMEECCTQKYGPCTIASFKRNTTNNCQHFNCQPVKKCKFQPSIYTDTFVFSSEDLQNPSKKTLTNSTQLPDTTTHELNTYYNDRSDTTTPDLNSFEEPKAKEEIAAPYSEEQTLLKNDNTTIKPRKGVENFVSPSSVPKSGVKPRKGVGIQNVPHYPDAANASLESTNSDDDVIFELQKVFADDPENSSSSQIVPSTVVESSLETISSTYSPISVNPSEITTTDMVVGSFSGSSLDHTSSSTLPTTTSTPVLETSTYSTVSSLRNDSITSSTSCIPSFTSGISRISVLPTPVISASAILSEHYVPTKPLMSEASSSEDVDDDERKYRSSIHLVIALVFGLIVLLSVLAVVGKRMYDRWVRRDYFRMNYLIDGIYHGDD